MTTWQMSGRLLNRQGACNIAHSLKWHNLTAVKDITLYFRLCIPISKISSQQTYCFFHHNLIFLPQHAKSTPSGMSRGYGMSIYPAPTGILIEICAGVSLQIHGIYHRAGYSDTGWCQAVF